ncbi:hypothetical protein LTR36_006328 [Oleoguttula mirabilis]|uniref:DUF7703 domain-containing protein n=1 Tax=Oleoguttula mirabilis TaxID=1507867 RepID=A0AAV9JW61_9PEZI|nr:hypothetical protein LTR36_006328 [Oleoguttula mirabilis]
MGINEALANNLHDTTTFFEGRFDAQTITVVVCCALALNSALMLLLIIFTTFRHYRGLYFWSLVISSSAILPYTIGFMIEYFQLTAQLAGLVITTYGWPAMVTGQSLVLYSRLGVVLGKQRGALLKKMKWMIIVDGVVFHVTTTVVVFGAYYVPPGHMWMKAYKYVEKIQMTGFTLQEFIISGLYIWRTLDILQTTDPGRTRTRRVMWQLFGISVIIVVLDIALLVVEYQNRHVIEQALKAAVYGIKLKLEFAILSKLVGITKANDSTYLAAFEEYDNLASHDRSCTSDDVRSADGSKWVCRRCSKADIDKSITIQIERRSSGLTSLTPGTGDDWILPLGQPQPIYTADEQRRRRTLEGDLYAGACRDIGT